MVLALLLFLKFIIANELIKAVFILEIFIIKKLLDKW
jgi:hypothetical protein